MVSHSRLASIDPKQLLSGNYADTCDDCGAVIVGATVEDCLAATCACNQGRIVGHVVDLGCMQCGREIHTLTVPHVDSRILIPAGLRCTVCGGQPIVSDMTAVSVYPDLPKMKVKPGRPRKRQAIA
ncbi:MAG: hypothetical protein JOZ81_01985 [Chloroflexi bacterium]|nr:hypothetical protein [Chloroflexota bacterium]